RVSIFSRQDRINHRRLGATLFPIGIIKSEPIGSRHFIQSREFHPLLVHLSRLYYLGYHYDQRVTRGRYHPLPVPGNCVIRTPFSPQTNPELIIHVIICLRAAGLPSIFRRCQFPTKLASSVYELKSPPVWLCRWARPHESSPA